MDNNNNLNFECDDENVRRKLSIDTVSLIENDCAPDNIEDICQSQYDFQYLLRNMNLIEKFICLATEYGYQMNEIAWVMKVHPSTITRKFQNVQIKIKKLQLRAIKAPK